MRDDEERLRDMLLAVERIAKYAARGREAFADDELVQTWILHHLALLGEACRGVSSEFREAHPEIPWAKIIGQRNILVHHYFGIDLDLVWTVVQQDLPDLRQGILAVLAETGEKE